VLSPALATEAQIALALRTLGGLATEEIARAFLVPVRTIAQRLGRAKAKIRLACIPVCSSGRRCADRAARGGECTAAMIRKVRWIDAVTLHELGVRSSGWPMKRL
jgi:predicted RNA polymerase sigma factor